MTIENRQLKHEEISFDKKQFPICVLANNLQLAGNMGSLFRIADAFGVEKIYFSEPSESVSKLKIRKAARSTQEQVDYQTIASEIKLVKKLKKQGYRIICLEITSASIALREFMKKQAVGDLDKICLIIGSEKEGIDQELINAADDTIHIPMVGNNTSMNVVTAAAIALYEFTQG